MVKRQHGSLTPFSRFSTLQKLVLSFIVMLFGFAISASTLAESDGDTEFLPNHQAFILTAKLIDIKDLTKNTGVNNPVTLDNAKSPSPNPKEYKLALHIKIAPGYLLYKDHLKITTLDKKPFASSGPVFPEPILKEDEILGKQQVYKNEVTVITPISFHEKDAGVIVEYQGCSEKGFCYAPQTKKVFCTPLSPELGVDIVDVNPNGSVNPNALLAVENTLFEEAQEAHTLSNEQTKPMALSNVDKQASLNQEDAKALPSDQSESDRIAGFFTSKSLPLTLLAFLSLGLLLAFTPCVLPMIPILANILVGQDAPKTRGRIFYLATLYVLSVSVCYAIAGLAAGMLGGHLQATLQQPQVLMCLGFLILIFAFNQCNFIEFRFPAIFSGFFGRLEQKHKQGSALGAITMGAVSAVMVSPCVTPALVGALTYIGQTGNAFLGGLALFSLAFGMGLPLLIMASIGSHFLPKAGAWMSYVKNATAVLLLVLAGSIFYRAFPAGEIQMASTDKGEISQISSHAMNSKESIQGLENAGEKASVFVSIQSPLELTEALQQAQAANKHVILDVYADWCISCRKMDKEVFENKVVLNNLKDVALLRLDLTRATPETQALQKQLDIIGPPMVLFFGPDGKETRSLRLAGSTKSNHFLKRINQFLGQKE